MEDKRRAQPPFRQRALHGDVARIEAAHEADLDKAPADAGFAPHDLKAGFDGGRERLFAEHRLAGLEAG